MNTVERTETAVTGHANGVPGALGHADPPRSLHDRFMASGLYRLFLWGPTPKGVTHDLSQLWPGNPQTGQDLLSGVFAHQGEVHTLDKATHIPPTASITWKKWFHSHAWLDDLRAISAPQAPYFAREWLSAWMDVNAQWSATAWSPDVTAKRLINWCVHWPFLVREDNAGPFELHLRKAAGTQARHLFKAPLNKYDGYEYFLSLKGQLVVSYVLLRSDRRKEYATTKLRDCVEQHILTDGGHIERNPERLADMLADLLEIKTFMATVRGSVPDWIQNAIDRAAPMMRTLRHPDGGFALFNGGLQGDPQRVDIILAQTETVAKPPLNAPHVGFQRLSAGDVHVVMDTGHPNRFGTAHHGGSLAFEMSVGKQRLIVNCGAHPNPDSPWRSALSATAAHSTVCVNDTSSASFRPDGRLRFGPETHAEPRQDTDAGCLVEARHDGYHPAFGLTHQRTLYLASHATDLRGEDRLMGKGGQTYAVRFHLHPDVRASLVGSGNFVLLRLPNDELWRLRTSGNDVKLEESVYLAHPGDMRRTEQIVISGPLTGNGALVKWAISRDTSP